MYIIELCGSTLGQGVGYKHIILGNKLLMFFILLQDGPPPLSPRYEKTSSQNKYVLF